MPDFNPNATPTTTQGTYGQIQDFGGGGMVYSDPRDNPNYNPPQQPHTPESTTDTPATTETSTQSSAPQPSPTGTPEQQSTVSNAQSDLSVASNDYQAAAKKVQDTINGITNGSVPLNAGEQSQVDSLKGQFQQLIEQQKLTNKGAEGLGNIRGYQSGAAEYDPSFQVKTIGSIVTGGINKIAELNTKMAGAVSSLTESLKDADIARVKEAWNVYKEAQKERADTLKTTIDSTQKAIKDANDLYLKQQESQLKKDTDARDFAEKVKEFNATQEEKKSEFKANQSLEYAKINAAKQKAASGGGGDVPPEVVDAVIKNPALINLYSYTMKGKVLNAVIAASAGTNTNIGKSILESKLNFDGAQTSVKDATKKLTNMTASESAAINTMQLAKDKLTEIQGDSTLLANIGSPKVRDAVLNLKKDWGGDPKVVAYTNYIVDALNEYGKVISGQTSGAGVTDAARGEASKIIDAGYNPDQLQAAFDSMEAAMAARTQGLQDSIGQATIKGIGGNNTPVLPQNLSSQDLYQAMFPPMGGSTPVDTSSIFNNFQLNP